MQKFRSALSFVIFGLDVLLGLAIAMVLEMVIVQHFAPFGVPKVSIATRIIAIVAALVPSVWILRRAFVKFFIRSETLVVKAPSKGRPSEDERTSLDRLPAFR